MYGLVDCNNFFVSCERVFRPDLASRPVVVAGNNDGCIVALSNEAKAIGLKRGMPVFKVRDIVRRENVAVLSGNHRLYGDMSSRVMATLESMAPDIEIYSIDEAFINMDGIAEADRVDYGRGIVRRIRRDTGIPTSLGIAPTKTLAKVAAKFAKRYPGYRSVCMIDTEEKRMKALEMTPVGDVWGIGRRLDRSLAGYCIDTALQFSCLPLELVKAKLNVTGERTWRELNGQACIGIENVEPEHQQICTSRTFSEMIMDYDRLVEAISGYVAIASRKLREQHSVALSLSVFIMTNHYRTDLPQYSASAVRHLDEPESDAMTLCKAAIDALKSVFREGYFYKRAGVIITEITGEESVQQSLFTDRGDRWKRQRLMNVVDEINRAGNFHDKIRLATQNAGTGTCHRSPYYTTRFSDIISVKS